MAEGELYSIDRLVEFGLSMAVATHMAHAMNVGLDAMRVPGVDKSMGPGAPCSYYVAIDGRAAGPFGESDLAQLISERVVTRESYVWKPGMTDWVLAEDMPDVLRLVALTPPPVPKGLDVQPFA